MHRMEIMYYIYIFGLKKNLRTYALRVRLYYNISEN